MLQPVNSDATTSSGTVRQPLRRRPGFWLGAYIGFLMLFTCLYLLSPHGFYQSNASIESGVSRATARTEGKIARSIATLHSVIEAGSTSVVGRDGWVGDVRGVEVSDLDAKEGSFFLGLPLTRRIEGRNEEGRASFSVTLAGSYQYEETDTVIGDASSTTVVNWRPVTVKALNLLGDSPIDPANLFPLHPRFLDLVESPPSSIPKDARWLGLRSDANESLIGLHHSTTGDLGLLPRDPLRMLYVSVVTQTTLGFGDIVPVTPLTRAMVGTQAFVGVVIAGFYLNFLVKRHG